MANQVSFSTPHHNFFVYVAPAPRQNKADVPQEKPVREMVIDGELCKVRVHDFLQHRYSFLGDFMCKLSYGISEKEMRKRLFQEYPNLNADSFVAFYLMEKIEN